MGDTFRKFILKYFIFLIVIITVGSFIFYLLIHVGVLDARKRSDMIYDSEYCENGEYCDFCEVKCICFYGWSGKQCDTLIENGTFYESNWWNYASLRLRNPEYGLNKSQCALLCKEDIECLGYTYNPLFNDTSYSECKHLQPSSGYDKPWLIVGYERIPEEPQVLRRNIEEIEDYMDPPPQEWLYLKNGIECFGYTCHYNDDYGLVYVDEITYRKKREVIDKFIISTYLWIFELNYHLNSINITASNKDILEISEMPYLQSLIVFPDNDIIAMSSRAELFSSMLGSDFSNPNITTLERDLSVSLIVPEKQYDIVLLTFSLYGRKSLPTLLANAYNHLKDGGKIFIRDKYYSYINSTVLTNWCMAAGMAKEKLLTDYFKKFKKLEYWESEEEMEPEDVWAENDPFKLKNNVCWLYNDDYYHPGHTGKWFVFVGKK